MQVMMTEGGGGHDKLGADVSVGKNSRVASRSPTMTCFAGGPHAECGPYPDFLAWAPGFGVRSALFRS